MTERDGDSQATEADRANALKLAIELYKSGASRTQSSPSNGAIVMTARCFLAFMVDGDDTKEHDAALTALISWSERAVVWMQNPTGSPLAIVTELRQALKGLRHVREQLEAAGREEYRARA